MNSFQQRSFSHEPRKLAKYSVTVAPQIAPFVITEEPANWGDSISVVCAILKGDLPIEITWALNGEPIGRDRSDINILATTRKNSILSIESVAARHAGEYTCSASNKAGATSHSATLAVNGTFPQQRCSPIHFPLLHSLTIITVSSLPPSRCRWLRLGISLERNVSIL